MRQSPSGIEVAILALAKRTGRTGRRGRSETSVLSRLVLNRHPGKRHGIAIMNSLLSWKFGHRMVWILCALGVASATPEPAHADEGVWTFDSPPAKALQARYGFTPSVEWLDALRLSAVRLAGGSGSFVSANGLVLSNHHVAMGCLQALSTEANDLVKNGFYARTRSEERPCPGLDLRRLESTEDVTGKVRAAVKSTDDTLATAERNVAIAALENECKAKTGLRCEMVTLYRGAAYHLYRYKIWNDIRLVFAPEARLGDFGGDPDNFVFPRFNLDFSLLRVYEKGEAIKPAHFLKWAQTGVRDGDLVFVAGHPGSTDRRVTVAQLVYDRDIRYPLMLASANRARKVLQEYSARSPESARRAADMLIGTENWLKAMTGAYKSLREPDLIAAKTDEEARLRKSFVPTADYPDPWMKIEIATGKRARDVKPRWVVGYGFRTLFGAGGEIVELANETTLAEADRLPEYRASRVPLIVHRLSADRPYYKDLEIARLAASWQEAIDLLGKDDPFVVRVLGNKTPLAAATEAVEGSQTRSGRGAQETHRRRQSGGDGVDRSADRACPGCLSDAPTAGKEPRSRGRNTDSAGERRTGEDPFRVVRQGCVSRCHVLAAVELRQGQRLRRGWHADTVPDQSCGSVRPQFRLRRKAAV